MKKAFSNRGTFDIERIYQIYNYDDMLRYYCFFYNYFIILFAVHRGTAPTNMEGISRVHLFEFTASNENSGINVFYQEHISDVEGFSPRPAPFLPHP